MVFRYKYYVMKENIKFQGDRTDNRRYLLEINLINNKDKPILVIMKNPSLADQNISDRTINNVLKFCYSKQYSKVYIMNLYSYYSTDPDVIANLIKNNQEEFAIGINNDAILQKVSNRVNDVIVAWGGNTFAHTARYKNRIEQVTRIIERKNLYYVEELNGHRWYPKHPQVWSVNNNIEVYRWVPPF